jgi:hypothetical protein
MSKVMAFRCPTNEENWIKDFSKTTGLSQTEIIMKSILAYKNGFENEKPKNSVLFDEKIENEENTLFFFNSCLSIITTELQKGIYEISNENFNIRLVIDSEINDIRIKHLKEKNKIEIHIDYELINHSELCLFMLMSLWFFYFNNDNNLNDNQNHLCSDLKSLNFLKENKKKALKGWGFIDLHLNLYNHLLKTKGAISEINHVRICQIRDFK